MAASRRMVVLMGVLLTAFAMLTAVMQQVSGLNLVDFATSVMCFSYAGMMGVFITALFTKRGNTHSVVAALIVGFLTVLFLQPYIFEPVTEALFGAPVVLAWPWWCPIGVAVSLLVCLCGKSKPKINTQTI